MMSHRWLSRREATRDWRTGAAIILWESHESGDTSVSRDNLI